MEEVGDKFVAAWGVFAQTCGAFVAPEPTYQAWFAHYLISQFGIDRVAREPIIKKQHFTDTEWKSRVDGDHVRLDAVVTRTPGIRLPHYANRLTPAADGTGLEVIRDLAVISELKVAATQGGGLIHQAVARDVWKLSMLLDEFALRYPDEPLPLAYACILDNHPTKVYNWDHLDRLLASLPPHGGVQILRATAPTRPSLEPR